MKVIICGAGQVGFGIARYLAREGNDITVIDQNPDLIRRISDSLDVQAIIGHAPHPSVLEQAGAATADMLIAVTYADEVNMVACQIAQTLFNLPTKIARIRHQNYLDPMWGDLFSSEGLPIDVIISPEIEVARAIRRRLEVPGAIEVISLADDKVRLIGVHCTSDTPVVNTPLRQLQVLFPEINTVVVGVVRGDKTIVPKADDQLQVGDDVYFVVDTEQTQRVLSAFGHDEEKARRLLIFGAGNIGMFLCKIIEEECPNTSVTVVEINKEQADRAARALKRFTVLHGDVLDSDLQREAGAAQADVVIALTNDDETNILSTFLAKHVGAKRSIVLINKESFANMVGPMGVDVVVNPRAITVSNVLHYVRRGRIHGAHSLRDGFGEVIEADALETSSLVGKPLRDVKLPKGILVGALVREGKVISPRGDTVILAGDRVIIFAAAEAVKKVEKLFSVRLEYF